MVDRCQITKPGIGPRQMDPVTLEYTDPPRVTVYEGKCRFQIRGQSASTPEAGEREWIVQTSLLQLPVVGSEGVRPNHIVEATASKHDAALVGRKFTVAEWNGKSFATKRELPVKEVTG